jgi:hypothetical protein
MYGQQNIPHIVAGDCEGKQKNQVPNSQPLPF